MRLLWPWWHQVWLRLQRMRSPPPSSAKCPQKGRALWDATGSNRRPAVMPRRWVVSRGVSSSAERSTPHLPVSAERSDYCHAPERPCGASPKRSQRGRCRTLYLALRSSRLASAKSGSRKVRVDTHCAPVSLSSLFRIPTRQPQGTRHPPSSQPQVAA
jgi:hypothetical protein